MTILRVVLERTISIMLLAAIAIDLVLIGALLLSKRELTAARAAYGRAEGHPGTPTLIGLGYGGRPLELDTKNAGYAVWFASSRCPYCQKDQEWPPLAGALERRGVTILVLLPSAADSFPSDEPMPGSAEQIVYVNPEWLKRYPLSVTPTLLIFDNEHRLVWHRYGMLRAADTAAALKALDRAVRR